MNADIDGGTFSQTEHPNASSKSHSGNGYSASMVVDAIKLTCGLWVVPFRPATECETVEEYETALKNFDKRRRNDSKPEPS